MGRFQLFLLGALLVGCTASNGWAPGPNAQVKDFQMQSSRCSIVSRRGADSGGGGIWEIGRAQADYDDCMRGAGWVVVEQRPRF